MAPSEPRGWHLRLSARPFACSGPPLGVGSHRRDRSTGREPRTMVDPRREQAVNEAAERFADTLAESYRIVYEQAAEARERQGRLAQDFSERVMDHLKDQVESGRAASERLADQSRRQQEAGRALARESVNAYVDFLNT